MSNGNRQDPALAYNFAISLVQSASAGAFLSLTVGVPPQGGFSEASGLEVTIAPEEYREGGNNGTVLKFPGHAVWPNLKLRHGLVASTDLWNWHQDFLDGRGKRRDGVVTLLDETGSPVRSWRFVRGLPVRWLGPTLNAHEGKVAIEEIEIAHEGLTETGGDGSLLDSIKSLF